MGTVLHGFTSAICKVTFTLVVLVAATAAHGAQGSPFDAIQEQLDEILANQAQLGDLEAIQSQLAEIQAQLDDLDAIPSQLSTIQGQLDDVVAAQAALADQIAGIDSANRSWSRRLPDEERFELVLGDEAVLDGETDLVWARVPFLASGDFESLRQKAISTIIGARGGWRLPTRVELLTLANLDTWLATGMIEGVSTAPTTPLFDLSVFAANSRIVVADSGVLGTRFADNTTLSIRSVRFESSSGSPTRDVTASRLLPIERVLWLVRGGKGYDGNQDPLRESFD